MGQGGKSDVFADIAIQEISYRAKDLIEPSPPVLPKRVLNLEERDPDVIFTARKKISTEEELRAELDRYKEKYRKFMADEAPAVKTLRSRIELKTFDWRIETAEDKKNFTGVLEGKGEWQRVDIPHYGEPLGKAATYYRTTFKLDQEDVSGRAVFIHFKGVDYKAHVFVNGGYAGSHEGFFAPFEFDISDALKAGVNTIVVKVENDFICGGNEAWGTPIGGDKIYAASGLGYDEPKLGWHHCPPGMGIYQDVYIEVRPRVFISDIYVRPLPEEKRAQAWIEVYNCDIEKQDARISISVYGQNFKETLFEDLEYVPQGVNVSGLNDEFGKAMAKANGTYNKAVPLYIEKGVNYFKVPFEIKDFRWWGLDEPWLYQVQVKLSATKGEVIDAERRQFGMRSFKMDETSTPKGALFFNGEPIRLRGTNTMGHEQQCVLRRDWEQLIEDILLAKICNLNFLRLTQRPVQEEVYDYCDKLGLMTQTDLPTFGVIRRNQYCEALRQCAEMERLVRSHPCNIMVSYINEPSPNAGNRPHRHLTRDELENLFKAADDIIHDLNPERVIKPCDGDYDPPSPGLQDRHCYPCWYNGHGVDIGRLHRGYWQYTKPDWYYACGEFGAEGLECKDLMRRRYPKEWLPQDEREEENWSPGNICRAQTGIFHYFFYDTQNSLKDWIAASQEHQAWSAKVMTEALRRDNRMVSFAIHLLIDAWPSGWMKTIMDCERRPKKAFFAYREALAPLMVSLRTDRFKFYSGEAARIESWISNDTNSVWTNAKLFYILESDGKMLLAKKSEATIEKCRSTFQHYIEFACPEVNERTEIRLRVGLVDADGSAIADNDLMIEVFGRTEIRPVGRICVLGNQQGCAKQLSDELGLQSGSMQDGGVILVESYEDYKANEAAVNEAAANGARVIFMELDEGVYDIGGGEVKVKASRFNPLHFASRKTGHELVDGFRWDDFKHWYSPADDRIKAILDATFTGEGFKAVLLSANIEGGKWVRELAAGERKYGKGSFIICQVQLAGRTGTNPTARMFALKLLGIEGQKSHLGAGKT